MKVKENYLHEALRADRNDNKTDSTNNARRRSPSLEHSENDGKFSRTDAPVKDETKFANLLESPAKLQKSEQRDENSGEERRDDQKKDKKLDARQKDSTENLTGDPKTDNYESAGNQTGGGQSGGFGMQSGVGGLLLNENFAARSILHIADLERLVSSIRAQIGLGGRREIVLQLKRSVLEGLQVKIVTEPGAKVQIEFLAQSEAARSQIEKHSAELAGILRGRGINLETIKTALGSKSEGNENSPNGEETNRIVRTETGSAAGTDAPLLSGNNTFDSPDGDEGKIYNA